MRVVLCEHYPHKRAIFLFITKTDNEERKMQGEAGVAIRRPRPPLLRHRHMQVSPPFFRNSASNFSLRDVCFPNFRSRSFRDPASSWHTPGVFEIKLAIQIKFSHFIWEHQGEHMWPRRYARLNYARLFFRNPHISTERGVNKCYAVLHGASV